MDTESGKLNRFSKNFPRMALMKVTLVLTIFENRKRVIMLVALSSKRMLVKPKNRFNQLYILQLYILHTVEFYLFDEYALCTYNYVHYLLLVFMFSISGDLLFYSFIEFFEI